MYGTAVFAALLAVAGLASGSVLRDYSEYFSDDLEDLAIAVRPAYDNCTGPTSNRTWFDDIREWKCRYCLYNPDFVLCKRLFVPKSSAAPAPEDVTAATEPAPTPAKDTEDTTPDESIISQTAVPIALLASDRLRKRIVAVAEAGDEAGNGSGDQAGDEAGNGSGDEAGDEAGNGTGTEPGTKYHTMVVPHFNDGHRTTDADRDVTADAGREPTTDSYLIVTTTDADDGETPDNGDGDGGYPTPFPVYVVYDGRFRTAG